MNCKSVESRLSAYIDRELGGDELLEIRAHLSACRSCREEAEQLKSLKMLLGSVPCPEPPEGLADRLTANIIKERYPEPRRALRVSAMMFAGIAACSMLVTLFITSLTVRHPINPIRTTQTDGSMVGSTNPNVLTGPDNSVPLVSVANYNPR